MRTSDQEEKYHHDIPSVRPTSGACRTEYRIVSFKRGRPHSIQKQKVLRRPKVLIIYGMDGHHDNCYVIRIRFKYLICIDFLFWLR